MAQIIAGLLSIPLAEVGKQIGLALISAGTHKAFDLIFGGSSTKPDPETKKAIEEFRRDLKQIQTGIEQIGKAVSALRLNIKTDMVQEHVENIRPLIIQYWAAIDALSDAAASQPSEEKNTAYKKARKRCTELGQIVSNTFFTEVTHIHKFVADQGSQSLLALMNDAELGEHDFYTYYCRMRLHLLAYWSVMAQARSLMEFVQRDPEVNFTDGPRLIDDVNAMIASEEEFFNKLVPQSVSQLAVALMKDEGKAGKIDVKFQSQEDKYVTGSVAVDNVVKLTIACRADQPEAKPWVMQAASPLSEPELNTDRYFTLAYEGIELTLQKSQQDEHLMVVTATGMPTVGKLRWKIWPLAEGKFRLEGLCEPPSQEVDHRYLCTFTEKDEVFVRTAEKVDPGDSSQLFIFKLP